MTFKQLGLVAIASSVLSSGVVLADFSELEDWKEGFYALGGVAYGRVDNAKLESDQRFNASFGRDGDRTFIPTAKIADAQPNGNIGWRAGFGSWASKHFGIEFNYYGIANMDSTDDKSRHFRFDEHEYRVGSKNKLETSSMFAFDLTGATRYFFTDAFWGFGRLGVGYSHVERRSNGSFSAECFGEGCSPELFPADASSSYSDEASEVGLAAAVGLQWDITEVWGVRLEGNTIQTTDNDADMYQVSGNVVLNFGDWLM